MAEGHAELPDDTVDAAVPWRFFVGIGLLVAVFAGIYWLMSYEPAGTVMLALSGILSLWSGTYLWLNLRRRRHEHQAGPVVAEEGTHWEPHASVWPFGIAVGLALVLNGLLIGVWFLVPGVTALVLSLVGFVAESRRRA